MSSFRGITPGAIHWYGQAWKYDDKTDSYEYEDVEKELSENDVKVLNAAREYKYDYEYDVGDTTIRFNTAAEVLSNGHRMLMEKYGDDIQVEIGDHENLDNTVLFND